MKLQNTAHVKIHDGCTVTLKDQEVTVSGPRGELKRNFNMCPLQMRIEGNTIFVTCWFPRAKLNAIPQTVVTHIDNMMTGVTKGYCFTMKAAHAHFPMEFVVKGSHVEVRNFIGQKDVMTTKAMDGVTFQYDKEKKNELKVIGNDLEKVAQTCASIHSSCKVYNKDIRKFLDGVYLFSRANCE